MLGLPHLYTFGTLAFFDCGGTRLMLAQEKGGAAKESILYLRVADIAATHDALKQRGVRFTHAPHMIHRHADGTEEWMAFFEDPGRTAAGHHGRKWGQTPVPRQMRSDPIFDIFLIRSPRSPTAANRDTVPR